ncbi:MAG TPA: SIMPL domain-containing protein [Acidimicrobiia bacterium]
MLSPSIVTFRHTAIACIGAGALALGACSSSSHPAAAPVARPAVLPIASRSTSTPGQISVSGHGVVEGEPDTLTLSLGVSVQRPTASAAISDMESSAQALINQLVASGVDKSDIQTTQLSVNPTYDNHSHLTGFNASNQVSADLHQMSRAGAVIDAAARAAGSAISLGGVSFSIQNSSHLVRAARKQAVQAAADQARQLAAAAGVKLAAVKSITETNENSPVPESFAVDSAGLAARASVPIEPGKQSLSIDVTVVYAINQ